MPRHTNTESPAEAILHPGVVKAGQLIRSGKRIRLSAEDSLKLQWPPEILELVDAFLQTGQIDTLVRLWKNS